MKKNKNYVPEEILITFGNANISKLGGGKWIQDHIHILSNVVPPKKKKCAWEHGEQPGRNCNKMLANTFFLHLNLTPLKGYSKFRDI